MLASHVSGRGLVLVVSLVAPLVGWAPNIQAQTELRWKFQKGQTLRYSLKQESNSSTNVQGNQVENATNQIFDMIWTIKAVNPDGSAEMTQTFERVRIQLDGLLGQIAFDSEDDKDAEGGAAALGQVFRGLVGGEATLVMTPLGEVKDVKLPEKIVEVLKNAPAGPGGQRMLSEERITDIIRQATVILPQKALALGDTWTTRKELPQPPLGSMDVDTTYRFQGPDADNKALDRFGVQSTLALKVNPDLPLKVTLKEQKVEGEIAFHREAGRLVRSQLVQTLVLGLEAMGQQLDQQSTTKISITLDEGTGAN